MSWIITALTLAASMMQPVPTNDLIYTIEAVDDDTIKIVSHIDSSGQPFFTESGPFWLRSTGSQTPMLYFEPDVLGGRPHVKMTNNFDSSGTGQEFWSTKIEIRFTTPGGQ